MAAGRAPMSGDWSEAENDAIVADYFDMLAKDETGARYSKAEHNRRLQALTGRARGSVEFKHQNISAVLMGLGESWIQGYKPRANFQEALEAAVLRWLARHPEWYSRAPRSRAPGPDHSVSHEGQLRMGPPPAHRNAPPLADLQRMGEIARKYDVAGRDARNRALGEAGEERVLTHERATLLGAGRTDLAERVRWVSHVDGDGAGYDIRSFNPDGSERLIEVKTTNGWERTPFHITRNELAVAERHQEAWRLVRLWNFAREPRGFELAPPLGAHVTLAPTSFLASFA